MKNSRYKKPSLWAVLKIEIYVAFLLGSVPMLLLWKFNEEFDPSKYLGSLHPTDPVFIYTASLCIIHFILACFRMKYSHKLIQIREQYAEMIEFTSQLSSGLHGFYRVITGVLPTGLVILFQQHGIPRGWELVTGFTLFVAACGVVACVVIGYMSESVKQNEIKL